MTACRIRGRPDILLFSTDSKSMIKSANDSLCKSSVDFIRDDAIDACPRYIFNHLSSTANRRITQLVAPELLEFLRSSVNSLNVFDYMFIVLNSSI